MIGTNIRDIDIAGGTHIPVPGAKELLSTQVTMQGSGKEGVPPFSVSSSLALFSLSDGKWKDWLVKTWTFGSCLLLE